MPNIGDIVRYLNAVGGGPIVRIEGNIAWVDDDGFETPVPVRECVVVRTAEQAAATNKAAQKPDPAKTAVAPKPASAPAPTKATDAHTEPDPAEEAEEVPGGDKLNITVGFEPTERSRLSETDFDASLINDSNYYLYFTLTSRDDDSADWTTRYAGIVEPNTELWLGTFTRADIALFDRLCLQYVAFKRGKEFVQKAPGSIELKVDTTKFFKLHCYHTNPYFDNEVLAFAFVEDDVPATAKAVNLEPLRTITLPPDNRRPERRPVNRRNAANPRAKKADNTNPNEPLVVDLHIDSLLDNTRGMSTADILNYQVDTFREIMDKNLRNFGRKIIFIHGKGEGVLRKALTKELNHRYRGHDVQDASFQEYGYGATQVTIRQHPDKFDHRQK